MEDSRRLGLRHWAFNDPNLLKDHLREHPALKLMDLIGERDAAILERNTAIAEKKAAYAERDAAFLQRDVAYAERNNALMERDAAIAALDLLRPERDRRESSANDATSKLMQMVNVAVSLPLLGTELQAIPIHRGTVFGAALDDKLTTKEGMKTEQEKKRGPNEVDQEVLVSKPPSKKKKQHELTSDSKKVESDTEKQETKPSNIFAVETAALPVPYCSCTGANQPCYRWGNGGWQSACCTNSISMHPLPMSPRKHGSRVPGRKMTGGAFKKLLEKLLSQGASISSPVDLKNHWAKHGTNKYVTIK